jgi:hypothetical protein
MKIGIQLLLEGDGLEEKLSEKVNANPDFSQQLAIVLAQNVALGAGLQLRDDVKICGFSIEKVPPKEEQAAPNESNS